MFHSEHHKGGEGMEKNTENNEIHPTPKRMIVALLYPAKRHHKNMDQKTRDFLHKIEQQIHLEDILYDWENSLLEVECRLSLFWNPACEGYAHIGRKGSHWLAQVSLLADGVQYDMVRYVFSFFPKAEDILTANTLNQIYAFYRSQTVKVSEIPCVKCGTFFHWIEQGGTLEYKWVSLQEQYCGCED